ncbi:MAG: hypothetical protein NVSMB55_08850 [Mycobacteriales bacterium]
MRVTPLALSPADADYFDQARPELVAVARRHNMRGRTLDVGCSRGWLGRELMTAGLASEVHGIELNEAAAAVAGSRLTSVRRRNLEAPGLLEDIDGEFDTVVFADVLEHLTKPEVVLTQVLSRLRPGGRALISLPNVRHHAVVRDLVLKNRWDYQDAGVLDRTHMRFFTSVTAQAMCEQAGLTVESVYAGVGPRARHPLRLVPRLVTFAAAQMVLAAVKPA